MRVDIKNLKECEVEEIQKFTLEHVIEIEEEVKTVQNLKDKINDRFGQTDRKKGFRG